MKRTVLTLGTLAFLISPSLFALEVGASLKTKLRVQSGLSVEKGQRRLGYEAKQIEQYKERQRYEQPREREGYEPRQKQKYEEREHYDQNQPYESANKVKVQGNMSGLKGGKGQRKGLDLKGKGSGTLSVGKR